MKLPMPVLPIIAIWKAFQRFMHEFVDVLIPVYIKSN
jgi:hypothetical protein